MYLAKTEKAELKTFLQKLKIEISLYQVGLIGESRFEFNFNVKRRNRSFWFSFSCHRERVEKENYSPTSDELLECLCTDEEMYTSAEGVKAEIFELAGWNIDSIADTETYSIFKNDVANFQRLFSVDELADLNEILERD